MSRYGPTGSWGINVNVGGDDFVHSIIHTGGPLRPEGVLGVLSDDGVVSSFNPPESVSTL